MQHRIIRVILKTGLQAVSLVWLFGGRIPRFITALAFKFAIVTV